MVIGECIDHIWSILRKCGAREVPLNISIRRRGRRTGIRSAGLLRDYRNIAERVDVFTESKKPIIEHYSLNIRYFAPVADKFVM